MSSALRTRLLELDPQLHGKFLVFVERISPTLGSIELRFPEFTRHDPTHILALETIAAEILHPEAYSQLGAADLFVLLCSLWLHDAGMGVVPQIEEKHRTGATFKNKAARQARVGMSEESAWRDYVRENHHLFCAELAEIFLNDLVNPFYKYEIGRIARSHGERLLHIRADWPKRKTLGTGSHVHPALLAVVLRLSDIMHFSDDRAPEYMIEHRHITNLLSLSHWRAHQVAAGHSIVDDVCYFDGVTSDDEAFWFAQQFITAMDEELSYCKREVLPDVLAGPVLNFSRIHSRIRSEGFVAGGTRPVQIGVDTQRVVTELLNTALYAGQPAWFRELLQNAFDACRDLVAVDSQQSPSVTIFVDTEANTISFDDSGVGMTRNTVERFLLIAGASYWASPEYQTRDGNRTGHVGRFGVGFMSVFAVAEAVVIETRYVQAAECNKFIIRSPRQVVRVELVERFSSGTTITLGLRPGVLAKNDPEELLVRYCSQPEFPIRLEIDGEVVADLPVSSDLTDLHPKLELSSTRHHDVKLLQRSFSEPGLEAVFSLAKIRVNALRAYVPDHLGMLSRTGYQLPGQSSLYYGGINYPPLFGVEGCPSRIPSMGILQMRVSPEAFSLEMNLARDQYQPGEATTRLLSRVCEHLDNIVAEDLDEELSSQSDSWVKSAICALYSRAMVQGWITHRTGPGHQISGANTALSMINGDSLVEPWPRVTRLMLENLCFRCFQKEDSDLERTLGALVTEGALVFAVGSSGRGIDAEIRRAIFDYVPHATLVLCIPEHDFGLTQLRQWAVEEHLVPVPSFSRTAYGLQLAPEKTALPFMQSAFSPLPIPVASGPAQWAVLDYRDLMAEINGMPTGSPEIVAAMNQNHPAIASMLTLYQKLDPGRIPQQVQRAGRRVRDALRLGYGTDYHSETASRLVLELNLFAQALGSSVSVTSRDIPDYFNGGQVRPFGRYTLPNITIQALSELRDLEGTQIPLS